MDNLNTKNMQEIIEQIFTENIIRVVLSGKKNLANPYNKIVIAKKKIKNIEMYQLEKYTDKQVFHENVSIADIKEVIITFLLEAFRNLNAWTDEHEHSITISKKEKVLYSKKKTSAPKVPLESLKASHNRQKEYILEEGTVIPPLIKLGVFTKEGKVVNSMYDKYKQINRSIEIIDDVIREKEYKSINIVDFGCGKSYLTFILYYYLKEIKKIDVNITGLDLKADVIRKCNEIAKEFGYEKLVFKVGDISSYDHHSQVHMVITLHACDTATDYALYNAIKWNAEIILSVPCCQHEINKQITSEKLSILTKYGILKDRFSSILSDAIRGNLLEATGYQTQIMEFVDFAHSPKNVLIRAVKKTRSRDQKIKAINEVKSIMSEFELKPTLYELLKDDLVK